MRRGCRRIAVAPSIAVAAYVPEMFDVLIVGSGHGGATVAAALRQRGFSGSIAMLTRESHPPYERPPLSKEYLAGERSIDQILLRPAAFWNERRIEFRPNEVAVAVAATKRLLHLDGGKSIGFGTLIWAAGGTARNLKCQGHDLHGVHTLRSLDDVDTLRSELPACRDVVIVGGGYLGLEAAAAFRKFGRKVTLLETMDRVLARVAGEPLSRFFEQEHRDHGVDVRLDARVTRIEGRGSRVAAVRMADGSVLRADIVIGGIGIDPSVEPLLAAGAAGTNGVAVDPVCATTLPNIYAIGDCALHENVFAHGQSVRIESVQNAHDQAQVVAKALTGSRAPYCAVPWFWSNQYDLKLQTVGLSLGFDEAVVRGDPATRSFSVVYFRGGKVIALDCVNAPKDFVQGRALVQSEAKLLPAAIADSAVALKDLVP
jgi:3-phenylpropionate/trans-cinnamate dioxygenase ferredoxin reductase component